MAIVVGAVAEPVIAAPESPERPAQTAPELPDATGTELDPADLDRDQDAVTDAVARVDAAAPTAADRQAAGGPDGGPSLSDSRRQQVGQDPESNVLLDNDGDGVLHPPVPDVQAVVQTGAAIGNPEPIPGQTPEPAWDQGLENLVERADEIDLTDYEVGEEIKELRTRGSRTFAEGNGKFHTDLSSRPLFVEDTRGKLVEPDPMPTGHRDGRWRPSAGLPGTSVASAASDRALGSVSFGQGSMISWSLKGAAAVVGRTTSEAVVYDDVFAGVDLEMAMTEIGVKETLVLADAQAPTTYEFPLRMIGLTAETNDAYDSIVLHDAKTGAPLGAIPGAWAVDSAPRAEGDFADPVPVAYELVGEGAEQILRLKVDPAWLHNPARQFPVRIDPAVIGDYKMTNDAWINSKYPTQDGSTTQYLKTGYAEGARRSYFVKWDVGWLVAATIIDADYKTYNSYSWSCAARPFQVYRVTSNWSPSTVTWYNQPSFSASALGSHNASFGYNASSCPANWFHNRMQSTVQGWVDGTIPNYGLTGRVSANDSYSDSYTYKVFSSSEASGNGGQVLGLTWSPYRAKYAGGALVKPNNTTAGSMQVTVTNKAPTTWNASGTDPFKLTYHIYHSNGTTLYRKDVRRAALPQNVAWGQSATITIPLDPQPPGSWKYKFEMVRDVAGTADHFFSGEGIHTDLTPLVVKVDIANYGPYIAEAEPGGLVDKTAPTLRALGQDSDGWPGDPLQYFFRICTDEEMTEGCKTRNWSTTATWKPPGLRWGEEYWWNASVREGNGADGRATTDPEWSAYLAPTVPQPKVERHFGADPNVQTSQGVNPAIGNYVTSAADVKVASAGLAVDLTRTYNSMDTRVGAFGPGWSTALDVSLVQEPDGKVLVSYPDGRRERYAQNPGDGTTPGDWVAGPGNLSKLKALTGGGWELARPDGMASVFNQAGRLTSIHDPWGNPLNFSYYAGTNKVSTIVNQPSGRSVSLTWAAQGPGGADVVTAAEALPAVGTAPPPRWTFAYTGGRLTSVCSPPQSDPDCTEYAYWPEDASRGRRGKLSSITRPEGLADNTHAVELDYRSDGRVTTTTNADGKTWTFSTDDDDAWGTYHAIDGYAAGSRTAIGNGASITQDLTSETVGMPATGVQAVVVDIQVSNATAGGWLSVYPNYTTEPAGVSTMDYLASETRSTLHTVALSGDGGIKMTNHGGTIDVRFDVVGWYGASNEATGGSVFVPLPTDRILETGATGGGGPIGAGQTRELQVTGQGGVPDEGVRAVVYDLEGINPSATTWLTAYGKGGQQVANVSTMSIKAGRTADNLHITRVGDDGKIVLYNNAGSINVNVNVVGYFADPDVHDGLVFRPITNTRLLDTRALGGQWASPWPVNTTRPVTAAGVKGVPAQGVAAIVGEVQGLAPTATSAMRVDPAGKVGEGTTYQAQANSNVGNQMYAGLGDDGAFNLTSTTRGMDVIVDVVGYFTPIPRQTAVVDPKGNYVWYLFDELGRLTDRYDEDLFLREFAYNEQGLLNYVGDEVSAREMRYDDEGRLVYEAADFWVDQPMTETWYGYVDDEANPATDGKLAWVNAPRSSGPDDTTYRTTYEYGALGQPLKVLGPAVGELPGVGVERTYTDANTPAVESGPTDKTPAGLLATSKDSSGLVTRYFYDVKGDLRLVEHPSPEVGGQRTRRDKYAYDALGRNISVTQYSQAYPAGVTTTMEYDDQGRLVRQTGPRATGLITHPIEGKDHQTRFEHDYDHNGNIVKTTETDLVGNTSRWVEFHYDDAGRSDSTLDSAGRTTRQTYDDNGNVATTTGVDSLKLSYDYNPRNLVTSVKALGVVHDPVDDPETATDVTLAEYRYDGVGRRVTEIDAKGRITSRLLRSDGSVKASIVSNVHEPDPDSGAPTPTARSVLRTAATYDEANLPVQQYTPTNVLHTENFGSQPPAAGWTGGSGWTTGSPTFVSTGVAVLRHEGGADGSVRVVANGTQSAFPAWRIAPDFSSYRRATWSGNSLRVEVVSGGTPRFVATDHLNAPIQDGDVVEVMFFGDRHVVLVNGVIEVDTTIGLHDDQYTGVGIASSAAGQSLKAFRFDRYLRTNNNFDQYGHMASSVVDPGGVDLQTEWTVKPDGRPEKVVRSRATDPTPGLAETVEYGYDPSTGALDWADEVVEAGARRRTDVSIDDRGLTTAVVSPEGVRTDTTYDELGRPTQVLEQARTIQVYGQQPTVVQPTSTFGYGAFGRPNATRDAAGRLTWHWLDNRGFPVATIRPAYTAPGGTAQDRVSMTTFDPAGRVLSTTDVAGERTDFTYNTLGQLVRRLDPAAGTAERAAWRYRYDNAGRLERQVDPLGAEVRNLWDDLDRLVGLAQDVTQPSGSTATFVAAQSYGDGGGVLRSRTPEGVVGTATYDVAGRPLATADAEGNATAFDYDELSRQIRVTAPDHSYVRSVPDLAGDVREELHYGRDGNYLGRATYEWNQDHQLVKAQTPQAYVDNYWTTYTYDDAGQLTARNTPVTSSHAITEQWAYDPLGRTTLYRDGRAKETWQTYNTIGLPEDSILPAAGAQTAEADRRWRTTYDARGLPTKRIAPGGATVSTTYDDMGRPIEVSGTGGDVATETRSLTYDLVGRVRRASTPSGAQNFTYDERGLLRSSTGGSGDSWLAYDGDGRTIERVDGSGTTSFTYDARGLPDTMTSSLTGQVGFDFDEMGRPETISYGSGGTTQRSFGYDQWGRIETDSLKTGTSVLYSAGYGYDLNGNILSKTTAGAGVPVAGQNSYTYDWLARITSWTNPANVVEGYTWDDASNRTQAGATSATYDAQNRLASTAGPDGLMTNTWAADGTIDSQNKQRRIGLVVADPANLSGDEAVLAWVLAAGGANLTLIDDGAAAPAANAVDVVLVAPTVNAGAVGTKYRDVTVPVVNLAADTWQASGMVNAAPVTKSGTSAHVATPSHPVAAGKTGTVTLLNSAGSLRAAAAGSLGSGATTVWAASSGSAEAVVATYDTAAATPAGAAPARRVTLAMSPGAMSSAGLDVLVAAIAWADDNSTTLGVTSFKFDALEQLRSITPPNTTAVNHTYDPLGRRLSSPTGALQYSGTDIRPVVDGANRYQPGPAGVVAVDDMAAGGGVWAHTDGHTDVVGTFSVGATQMAGAQAFSPWGERLGATGAASPLGYQSERQDLPGGLIGMGAREYDPDTGTFISRDPAADSNVPNGYSYTSANPLGYTDPTGECQMEWVQGRWQRWLGGWLARPTIGGAGSINTRARGCTWQQFGRYSQVDAWCEQGRIWCKHVGDHLIIDSRLYMWVWCGDARGCWFPPPKPPPPANQPPPNNPPPPNNNPPPHGPGGGGSGGGGSGGDGGSPAGGGGGWSSVGGDQNVIANPPPAPPSPTQQQVAATGSAVPNYNGRYQVDQHTGQIVDTGAASIATAPSSPTSVSAAPVNGTSTPGMTISNVEVGIGGMSREDFFIGRYCAHHHREDASCWNGRAAQNSRDFRVIADAISAQQEAARAEACRRDWWCNFSSSLSTPRGLVELASAIPVVGEVADAGLCAWDGGAYLFNGGSRSEAAWSCVGLVPEVGSYLREADNVTDAVRAADAAADMSHYADEAAGVTRYVDDVVCAANSFVPSTRVLMADGTIRAIEDVEVGDRVWAEDPETGDAGPRRVTAVITGNGRKDLVDLAVDGDVVTATDGHPFWIDDEGHWVHAEDLVPGDVLRSVDGDRAEIADVGHRSATQQVYNLTVEGIHTYFVEVGDDPVLVHNSNCFDGFDAIDNLDDYSPGQGFSGVYDPASGQMATRPSVEPGAASPPPGSVSQYGGHGQINSQLGQFGVDQSQTVGFTVVQQADGSLDIRWRSRSVNSNNWGSIDAPDAYRQEIIDAVAESTGRQVTG